MSNHSDVFLTVDDAAVLLCCTPKAIYSRIERGSLPGARKLGRRVLIHREVLLRSIEATAQPVEKFSRRATSALPSPQEGAPSSGGIGR